MDTTITETQKNTSVFIHLSTFLKYFFPFANFIAPLLIWSFNKEKSFVDNHGKQAINFQLSVLLYTILIGLICLPFAIIFAADIFTILETLDNAHSLSIGTIKNIAGYITLFGLAVLLLTALFIFEIYAVVNAAIHASQGKLYNYPFTISFIKTNQKSIINHEHTR